MSKFPKLSARNPKTISYEHIIQGVLEKEPVGDPWEYHVNTAKKLLHEAYFNRMAIAEVAIRACIIRRAGGDRHSAEFKQENELLSLRAFATAIELNPQTLYLWVSIKSVVFDKLPSTDRDIFQHDAGEKTYKAIGKKKEYSDEIIQTTYQRFANQTKEQKAASRVFKYVFSIKKVFLVTDFWKIFTDEQLDSLRSIIASILKRIIEIQDMRKAPSRKSRAKKADK
ncbi:MAG: hypothetical protein E6R04_07260 [Spirochaetes bacterium]|nr:MAG: hypothetical protein E6R04_07260 [Spirochaetota bacterium]